MSIKSKENVIQKILSNEKGNFSEKNNNMNNNYIKSGKHRKEKSKNKQSINYFPMIMKNLHKYETNKKKYDVCIINSIIFDQKNHKVAEFKNYLLWDEASEFLKRFYKEKESQDRIPKISEYYEKYTLFSPVYFGLEGMIVIIMNKWVKRKKKYLEYIEDNEDEEKEREKLHKKVNWNFEPIIRADLISVSKSLMSINTLELTKYEESGNNYKKLKDVIENLYSSKKNKNFKRSSKLEKTKNNYSLSFSELIEDLSSHYSVIVNNEEQNSINASKGNKNYTKKNSHSNKDSIMIEDKTKKTNLMKKKKISIYNKENDKIIQKNKDNLFKDTNKLGGYILNTDSNLYQVQESQTRNTIYNKNLKNTIKVHTISSFGLEKHELGNNLLKSNNSKNIKKSITKNNLNNNKNINFINKEFKISEKNNENMNGYSSKIIFNSKKLKVNEIASLKEINDNYNNKKGPLTYRNQYHKNQLGYLYERVNVNQNILNGYILTTSKNNNSNSSRKTDNNKCYLEDPFIYKMTHILKKKPISLTAANSLSKIKNENNIFHSNTHNFSNKSNNNTITKINSICHKKNLVLNKPNSKKEVNFVNKNKFINQEMSPFNKAISTSLNKNKYINIQLPDKISGSHSFRPSKKTSQKINLNLNLNIQLNINVDKNGKKRLIVNNAFYNNQTQKYPSINHKKYSNKLASSSSSSTKYTKSFNKGLKSEGKNFMKKREIGY